MVPIGSFVLGINNFKNSNNLNNTFILQYGKALAGNSESIVFNSCAFTSHYSLCALPYTEDPWKNAVGIRIANKTLSSFIIKLSFSGETNYKGGIMPLYYITIGY